MEKISKVIDGQKVQGNVLVRDKTKLHIEIAAPYVGLSIRRVLSSQACIGRDPEKYYDTPYGIQRAHDLLEDLYFSCVRSLEQYNMLTKALNLYDAQLPALDHELARLTVTPEMEQNNALRVSKLRLRRVELFETCFRDLFPNHEPAVCDVNYLRKYLKINKKEKP